MALPKFLANGDLPPGVHRATLAEVMARFGGGSQQRERVAERLSVIHRLANATGKVRRFVVFGSFVTDKAAPGDVDVFLVMDDDFVVGSIRGEAAVVFSHQLAAERMGASVFWVRAVAALGGEQKAVEYWQVTRGGGQRGIVEIVEPRS